MNFHVLSEKSLARMKQFLAEPASDWDPDGPRRCSPHAKILAWALDPELGGLPKYSAQPFANWLDNGWADWTEEEGVTVEQVLQGAIEDWCGGRVMPS